MIAFEIFVYDNKFLNFVMQESYCMFISLTLLCLNILKIWYLVLEKDRLLCKYLSPIFLYSNFLYSNIPIFLYLFILYSYIPIFLYFYIPMFLYFYIPIFLYSNIQQNFYIIIFKKSLFTHLSATSVLFICLMLYMFQFR